MQFQVSRLVGFLLVGGGLGLLLMVFPTWLWSVVVGAGLVALGWTILCQNRWL